MLRPREKIIAEAHSEIMCDRTIPSLEKGIFYSLLMNTYVGVGDIVTIPRSKVLEILRWYRPSTPEIDERAIGHMVNLGVVIIEDGP